MLNTQNQANAGEFDGYCFPATACESQPSKITNNMYDTCESTCTMMNPVPVRGMDAIIYDVVCKGDWGEKKQRQIFARIDGPNIPLKAISLQTDGVSNLYKCN